MAITDVATYAHLTRADLEAFAADLEKIREDVEGSRGEGDRAYILRTILFQRGLDIASRLVIGLSRGKVGLAAGTTALAVAKSIENMELAHNIGHGQWDWMNDPEVHSTTWEWDMVGPSSQWRYSHNFRHHVYTNVVGMDEDLGYGVMRVTRDEKWKVAHLTQPLRNLLMALTFEWGIALHDLHSEKERASEGGDPSATVKAFVRKTARQVGKDYALFPLLSGRRWRRTMAANATANLMRNVWAYVVICCGHFADGAEKFTPAALDGETKSGWYLRQMLGTANFDAGPVMAFMSGNLCYQIEHHLFPDLPSNRYAEISRRVQEVCDTYDLPYTTGSLPRQYLLSLRTIIKLAFPDRMLSATSDDAPETSSENKFSRNDALRSGASSELALAVS